MLWLWVLVLFKALQVHASSPSQAYCPMSREAHGIVKSQENIILVGHVIATIRAPSMVICSQRCLANHKCISVNYELTGGQCELNNYGVQKSEDVTTNNAKFRGKDGFVYSQMRTPNFLSLADRCADGSFSCANGGSCQFDCSTLRPQCRCPPGFYGETCQDDKCSPNPCQHAGTCEVAVEGYKCTCVAGYTGADCQTDINECSSSPCLNDGTCVDKVNNYTCNCTAGFTGENCNTNINECQGMNCQNGGTCEDGINSYTCKCVPGFSGDHCETDINECSSNPCLNGGTCADKVNGYTCNCAAGFAGEICNTNIDECQGVTCQNGGTCEDGINSYTCKCVPGFEGVKCETDIDECQGVTCQNGGSCEDGINSYTCKCVPGFAGDHCETEVNCVLNFTERSGTNNVSTTLGTTADTYSKFTFCMWYSLADVHRATFLSYADGIVSSSATSHFSIGINTDGHVEFGFKGKTYKVTENILPQSFWHSFCIEWSNSDGTLRLAIDGESTGQTDPDGDLRNAVVNGGGKLVIGQYQTCKGACFDDTLSYKGILTEVTFWDNRIGGSACDVYHSGACLSNGGARDGDLKMQWRHIFSQPISGNINAICPSLCKQAESCVLKFNNSVANNQSTVTLGSQGARYGEMSVCAWFYLDNPNDLNTIVSYTAGAGGTSFSIAINKTGQVEFSFQGYTERSLTSDFVIPVSTWIGMCFDWDDSGNLQVFKKGSASAVWSKTAVSWESVITGGGKLMVGHHLINLIQFDTSRSFQGMIAEVNVWQSTLGSSEAAKYLNDGQCLNSGKARGSEIIMKWANLLPRSYLSGVSKVCPAPCKV